MKSAALYVRVSTKDKQNPETQLHQLREYVRRRGIESTIEYVDKGFTGSLDKRPALDQLVKDARLRRFDAVIVARFDRFARSVKHLVISLDEFQSLGVEFISLAESIDTSTPMGKAMFTVIGAIAELERDIIRERVVAGVARAKTKGVLLGRPKRIVDRVKVRSLYEKHKSVREVARRLDVGKDTIAKIVAEERARLDASGKPAWDPDSYYPLFKRRSGSCRRV